MKLEKGFIQIYTGDGKGKTTAALGLALRAAGHGLKTYIGQFMKGQEYGELRSVKNLSSMIEIEQFGRDTFVHIKGPSPEDIRMALDGLEKVRRAMNEGKYDIVVADEILVARHFGLLKEEEILLLMEQKPHNVELILTGRKATQKMIEKADLVTEMKEVKHYFNEGIMARDGIER